MKYYDFDCRVITPLFLGGAETRVRPELRSASIRGAMRYWYRAILGGCTISDQANVERLKQCEADVFGTTEKGSAITVLVHTDQPLKTETFRKDRAVRTQEGNFLPTGKDYLLWSMAASGRPGTLRYQPDREYIKTDTQFKIRLQSRIVQGDDALTKASAALWLLSNLGGLGARANRGAGSFETELSEPICELIFKQYSTISELKEGLSKGIRQCLRLICGKDSWQSFESMPGYDILAPDAAEVWIVSEPEQGWDTAQAALNGIGEKLRDYRSCYNVSGIGKADHDDILRWLEGSEVTPGIRRAIFGLPIPFRYSESGLSDVIIPEQGNRRSSPLKIRITRLTTGKCVGVLTLFKSRFLETGKQLQLQTRKWKAPPPTDYKIIQNFIKTFKVSQEVSLQ